MPDTKHFISQIQLPTGTTYQLKDLEARQAIEALSNLDTVKFKGVSSTALTDLGTQNPTVGGQVVTVKNTGDLYFYNRAEFVWGADNKWHVLGDLTTLGELAYADAASTYYTPRGTVSKPSFTGSQMTISVTTAADANGNYQPSGTIAGGQFVGSNTTFTGSYTPQGSVTHSNTGTTARVVVNGSEELTYTPSGSISKPTISVNTAGSTATIHNPSAVNVVTGVNAVAPGQTAPTNNITYYSVANQVLSLYQLGYGSGNSITTSDVTVKTSDASYVSSTPTFSGSSVNLVTESFDVPSNFGFTGTQGNISTSGTPLGSNGASTFTGTTVEISASGTPRGSVSQPTFTGIQDQIIVEKHDEPI